MSGVVVCVGAHAWEVDIGRQLCLWTRLVNHVELAGAEWLDDTVPPHHARHEDDIGPAQMRGINASTVLNQQKGDPLGPRMLKRHALTVYDSCPAIVAPLKDTLHKLRKFLVAEMPMLDR